MKKVLCMECNERISSNATSCPKCGATNPFEADKIIKNINTRIKFIFREYSHEYEFMFTQFNFFNFINILKFFALGLFSFFFTFIGVTAQAKDHWGQKGDIIENTSAIITLILAFILCFLVYRITKKVIIWSKNNNYINFSKLPFHDAYPDPKGIDEFYKNILSSSLTQEGINIVNNINTKLNTEVNKSQSGSYCKNGLSGTISFIGSKIHFLIYAVFISFSSILISIIIFFSFDLISSPEFNSVSSPKFLQLAVVATIFIWSSCFIIAIGVQVYFIYLFQKWACYNNNFYRSLLVDFDDVLTKYT